MQMIALAIVVVVGLVGVLYAFGAYEPEPPPLPAPPPPPAALPPPIPAPPSPAHRLAPGVYMFGQLWRYDGVAWTAQIGDDCEPVVAIFDVPGLGTCAVTWEGAVLIVIHSSPFVALGAA